MKDIIMLPWRGWSRLCDLADAKLFTPHGRKLFWASVALTAGVALYEAFQ